MRARTQNYLSVVVQLQLRTTHLQDTELAYHFQNEAPQGFLSFFKRKGYHESKANPFHEINSLFQF